MRKDAIGFFWTDLPPVAKQKKEKVKRLPVEKVWERPDYLPGLDAAMRFAATDPRMTDGELIEMYLAQETFVYDIEIYKNYFNYPYPNRSTVIVDKLVVPGMKIEITVSAVDE